MEGKRKNVDDSVQFKKRKCQQNEEKEQLEEEKQEELEFEDDFEDEFEDEVYDDVEEEEEENDDQMDSRAKKQQSQKSKIQAYIQESSKLQEGEYLEFDNSAYQVFHRANTEWPCLSFDFLLKDYQNYQYKQTQCQKLGINDYPLEIYMVAGSQAAQNQGNQLYLMKMTNMHRTQNDDDSSDEEEDKENDEMINPELNVQKVQMKSGVNRVRSLLHSPIVALWNENGDFNIYNLEQKFKDLIEDNYTNNQLLQKKNKKNKKNTNDDLIRTFKNKNEGFALDWCNLRKGRLVSGSIDGKIYIYDARDEGLSDFARSDQPYIYHSDSVEDLQFSSTDDFAFASCSVDKTIRICDIRQNVKNKSAITISKAHENDVNVINWNSYSSNLLASGGDDGAFKVWDLRYLQKNTPLTDIVWHNKAITSIQMQPQSDSMMAVSSEDNRLSLWDFAVENDDENGQIDQDIPEQLMFLHQGLEHIKELRFHPIYYELIAATGQNGFHVFKPCLDDEIESQHSGEMFNNEVINEKELDQKLAQMSIV